MLGINPKAYIHSRQALCQLSYISSAQFFPLVFKLLNLGTPSFNHPKAWRLLQPHCWQRGVMAQLVHILVEQEAGTGQEVGPSHGLCALAKTHVSEFLHHQTVVGRCSFRSVSVQTGLPSLIQDPFPSPTLDTHIRGPLSEENSQRNTMMILFWMSRGTIGFFRKNSCSSFWLCRFKAPCRKGCC